MAEDHVGMYDIPTTGIDNNLMHLNSVRVKATIVHHIIGFMNVYIYIYIYIYTIQQ